jgi:hypothetical protein
VALVHHNGLVVARADQRSWWREVARAEALLRDRPAPCRTDGW